MNKIATWFKSKNSKHTIYAKLSTGECYQISETYHLMRHDNQYNYTWRKTPNIKIIDEIPYNCIQQEQSDVLLKTKRAFAYYLTIDDKRRLYVYNKKDPQYLA